MFLCIVLLDWSTNIFKFLPSRPSNTNSYHVQILDGFNRPEFQRLHSNLNVMFDPFLAFKSWYAQNNVHSSRYATHTLIPTSLLYQKP
jgi:hypothetical protein